MKGIILVMKIKEGYVLKQIAGRDIVVSTGAANIDFNAIISLNETGSFLWKILEKGSTIDELMTSFLAEYDADEETAKKDIQAFIKSCEEAGLIEE